MPSQDPCQGYDSFLLSSHDEWQTGHIHSEQDGGVKKSPFLGAKPRGYHTGQSLVVHCSPCQTRHGGNPLADLSEKNLEEKFSPLHLASKFPFMHDFSNAF